MSMIHWRSNCVWGLAHWAARELGGRPVEGDGLYSRQSTHLWELLKHRGIRHLLRLVEAQASWALSKERPRGGVFEISTLPLVQAPHPGSISQQENANTEAIFRGEQKGNTLPPGQRESSAVLSIAGITGHHGMMHKPPTPHSCSVEGSAERNIVDSTVRLNGQLSAGRSVIVNTACQMRVIECLAGIR